MKTATHSISTHLSGFGLLILTACLWFAPAARAGLTVDMHFYHDSIGYYFFPFLSTNTTPPAIPAGNYEIASWQVPTNGSSLFYHATATTFAYDSGGGTYYYDFDSFLYGITNKPWSIWVTNSTSTNYYTFTVKVTGLTSNVFGAPAVVTFPANNQQYVTNLPLFTWTGPANWNGTLQTWDYWIDTNGNYNYVDSTFLAPSEISWTPSVTLPNGTNSFTVYYNSNLTATVIASTPTNTAGGQAISGWISTAQMETSQGIQFTVGQPPGSGSSGHTNVAYYSFEDDNLFSHDFSEHGNDIGGYGWFSFPPYMTNDAAAGLWAVGYTGSGWQSPPTNLVAALAGSFSVSLWARTSDNPGNDSDTADSGAGLLSANSDQVIPMALTGSKLAFLTGGDSPDTLHSVTAINAGNYVHLLVTRDQVTGEKKIYVNGVLDASDFGVTGFLGTASDSSLYLGMNSTFSAGFKGDLDEVQIYSGVLSATEVATLYANPGTTIPDRAGTAGNGVVVHYDFDEGTVLAADVSGNNNNVVYAGNFGGSGPSISSDTVAGAGSVSFDGGSYLTASSNLLTTLAGNFTISLWVKTTQDNGDPNDLAWTGDAIISADIPYSGANDLIPVALTGGQVAFNTANTQYNYDDTINSSTTVNDGSWHHVVVSRNQPTGEKFIYIDGVLDTSDTDATNLLNDPQLLTIGCKADASNPDPTSPDYTGSNGYNGLVDDIQLYNRVLSSDEVAFLYNNPGATLTSTTNTPYPVDVSLQFSLIRSQDPNYGEIYGGGVSFSSVSPDPTTTNSVHSPHDYYSTMQYPGGGSGSGAILSSLSDVINEFTNGLWRIYINQDSPTQQVYSFQVSISGLDTNVLRAVKIFMPTNGAVNIATNPAFYWVGPSNFTTLQIELLSGPVAFPPVTATNWPSAPTLNYGSDRFDVDYNSNNFPGVTFTTPVDASSNPVRTWTTTVNLTSEAFDNFVVGAPAPLPVLLTNLTRVGGNLQFSFQTLAGRPHTVQSRTNLTAGTWANLTNFTGDGSLKQFAFPTTNPPIRFFRVQTQ